MAMRAFAVPGLFAIVLAAPAWPAAQDRAVAVPGMKVLLQNDRVRVQFHDVAVGDTTPMHSHPAYVAYVFDDYTAKAILADGREIPLVRKKGDVFYNEAVTHRIANTGTTPIHNLIVELKDPAPTGARGAQPASGPPDATVRLQNARVRVRMVEVPAGGTEPMHSHPAYVGYVFETYTAKAILADGSERQMARKAGDAYFSEAVTHEVHVTSATPLHNLIVELLDPPPAGAPPK
jgi:quercetin dioxygenase-like cupin family protein